MPSTRRQQPHDQKESPRHGFGRGCARRVPRGGDTLNGSAENDIVNGGADIDTLNGNAGNDRLTGNTQNDTFNGDAGSDVMVWNNGDGNDVMNGGAGLGDDAELNGGNNNEQFAASPLAGGRVKFERVAPAPINLDVSPDTERLVLSANAGDDTMASSPAVTTAMLLNGGVGADNLTGGAAGDFLNGGDDADTLNGGPGGDRVVGGRANDRMRGADGDDTLVWNNGDGTDDMSGENGLDAIEVDGAAVAEAFEVKPAGTGARFDRTNVGPFGLNIATSEVLQLDALGGDDTFLARPGTPLAVVANGGEGTDTLTGADEADTFFGGLGNDRLTGGGGPYLLDGQTGDDRLLARDKAGDLVRGGLGIDSAQADRVDVLSDVEHVDVPRPPVLVPNKMSVLTQNAVVRNLRTRLKLECSATGSGACAGRLALLTRKRYPVHGVRTQLVLAGAGYHLAPGEKKTLTLRLPKGIKKLAKKHFIAAVAQSNDGDELLALVVRKR